MEYKTELYYILSRNALQKLLRLGYLSEKEYALAEEYIAEKYHPLLRSA